MSLISLIRSLRDATVLRSLKGRLAAFGADEGGAVAILVAAAIIPLLVALGLATDTARGYMAKARLSQALDAAALAGGKAMLGDDADRDADIQMFFDANFPPGYMGAKIDPLVITENPAGDKLEVTARATINTTFMRVLGFKTLIVAAATEVTREVDQLDLVLSIDTSGSMNIPSTRIQGAKAAAIELIDILYGANTVSPTVTVDGVTYNLLNIGVVNWNSKVNVTIAGQAYTGSAPSTVPEFTNPVTGVNQSVLHYANNSPVPLLSAPGANWHGCVYARYTGDANRYPGDLVTTSNNTNDADLYLGPLENVGGNAGADWLGWEAIPTLDGEERNDLPNGNWSAAPTNETSSKWRNVNRNCFASYWNDTALNDPAALPVEPDDYPVAVPDRPPYWSQARPSIGNGTDCVTCPSVGILPLETDRATITTLINNLATGGTTNIPQGLAWAWEVLMPGEPFDEAVDSVPFPRHRAIVLLTDGANNGGNGDAYKGRFGSGEAAGTTTNAAHGYMPSPPDAANTRNNLNNRLLRLAASVKATPDMKLYVIQFANTGSALTTLLKAVASSPDAPYYFNAPTTEDLKTAFQQIANSLSQLRLSK